MHNHSLILLIKWLKIMWNIIKVQFVYAALNSIKSIILALTGFTTLSRNMQYTT
jgi:hypothetical protein